MKDKKGLEMGFAWIFAIIVGVAILALAIYGASRLINISQQEVDTTTSKSLLNVLDKVQTTVEESSSNIVPLALETRIYTSCNTEGDFGSTEISISEKIGFGGKYSEKPSKPVSSQNSYLFAEEVVEGKEINFLTYNFKLPFKVADLVIAYTEEYCFVSPPGKIQREVQGINANKIEVTESLNSCSSDSITVCFSGGNCDVEVRCQDGDCEFGSVVKDSRELYFTNGLLYGAIFSSKENYECNVERLMKRLGHLSTIYSQKAQFVAVRNCDTGLVGDLAILKEGTENYERTNDLSTVSLLAGNIDNQNEVLECHLY